MTKTVTGFARELGDREAIRDCLSRYGRAIDRADHALLYEIFWPDASIEFEGLINGPISEYIEKIVPETAQAMEQTAHFLGNMLIEIDGDCAVTESYVQAFHRLPNEDRPYDLVLGGRYLDRLEKRDDCWRILSRRFVCDWFREYADSADWEKGFYGLKMSAGKRFPEDLSYAHFASASG